MRLLRVLREHLLLVIGAAILAALVITCLLAPVISLSDPVKLNVLARLKPPSATYVLGTDEFGRDVLSRVIHGGRISLGVSAASVVIAMVGGVLIGATAGYHGGWVDRLLMRTMDGMMAFPPMLLAIAVAAVLGQGLRSVTIALGIVYMPRIALVVRAAALQVMPLEYVTAARALGASHPRIILKHLFPNVASPVIVQATLTFAYALLSEASLSFLGLGAPPPTATWGSILQGGRNFLPTAPWITLFPGLAISLSVLGLNLLGDGLRDLFDPRRS